MQITRCQVSPSLCGLQYADTQRASQTRPQVMESLGWQERSPVVTNPHCKYSLGVLSSVHLHNWARELQAVLCHPEQGPRPLPLPPVFAPLPSTLDECQVGPGTAGGAWSAV